MSTKSEVAVLHSQMFLPSSKCDVAYQRPRVSQYPPAKSTPVVATLEHSRDCALLSAVARCKYGLATTSDIDQASYDFDQVNASENASIVAGQCRN